MGSDDLHWLNKRKKLKRDDKLILEYKSSLLIVCEGEKTEPNYFEGFPTAGVKIEIIGKGKNTQSLVNDAISEWRKLAKEGKYFEKLWCVFDRDDFPLKNYNQAFETVVNEEIKLNRIFSKKVGRNISIRIAYSNEAFELWYLLHYDHHTGGIGRKQYLKILDDRMKIKYKKNDPNMYNILQNLSNETKGKKGQLFAIKNAKKLRASIKSTLPHNHNPSTSVDQLVIELNQFLKK